MLPPTHELLGALLPFCVLAIAVVITGLHRRYRPDLSPLARELGPDARTGKASVEGHLDGRAVRVLVGRDVTYSVQVTPGSAELFLDDARTARTWLREGGAHGAEVLAAVEHLATCGVRRIQVADGWLTAHRAFSGQATKSHSALSILEALARLAPLLGRAPLVVKVAGVDEHALAWAEGERLLCPYCRDDLAAVDIDLELVRCPACRTAHHAECFADARGCTVLGCRGAPERGARQRA